MSEEFDVDAVHSLVDEALGEEQAPEVRVDVNPLGFADTQLLEKFSELLPGWMHQADIQVLLSELRDSLFVDIEPRDLRALHAYTRTCKKCPQAKGRANLPMGNIARPDLVVVADNIPMHEPSYDLLISALKNAGFDPNRICITGATRCPFGRAPESAELSNCSGYLLAEIQELRPKLTITLGALATEAVLSTQVRITEEANQIHWVGPWAVLPMLAPAYVLRKESEQEFYSEIARAHYFCYGRNS